MKSGSSVSNRIVQEFTVIESIGERKKEGNEVRSISCFTFDSIPREANEQFMHAFGLLSQNSAFLTITTNVTA